VPKIENAGKSLVKVMMMEARAPRRIGFLKGQAGALTDF